MWRRPVVASTVRSAFGASGEAEMGSGKAGRRELPESDPGEKPPSRKKMFVHELPINWGVELNVRAPTPQELKAIVPMDQERAKLGAAGKQQGARIKREQEEMADARKERFEKGEEVAEEERPLSIGEITHQLMQSGDYGDGPPFPLRTPAVPEWRKHQPQVAAVAETSVAKLGKARATETVRCFQGDQELSCYGCPTLEEDSVVGGGQDPSTAPLRVAVMTGAGSLGRSPPCGAAPPLCSERLGGPGRPRLRQLRRAAVHGAFL